MNNATAGGITRLRINGLDIVPTSSPTTDSLTWEEAEGVVGIGADGKVCRLGCFCQSSSCLRVKCLCLHAIVEHVRTVH